MPISFVPTPTGRSLQSSPQKVPSNPTHLRLSIATRVNGQIAAVEGFTVDLNDSIGSLGQFVSGPDRCAAEHPARAAPDLANGVALDLDLNVPAGEYALVSEILDTDGNILDDAQVVYLNVTETGSTTTPPTTTAPSTGGSTSPTTTAPASGGGTSPTTTTAPSTGGSTSPTTTAPSTGGTTSPTTTTTPSTGGSASPNHDHGSVDWRPHLPHDHGSLHRRWDVPNHDHPIDRRPHLPHDHHALHRRQHVPNHDHPVDWRL